MEKTERAVAKKTDPFAVELTADLIVRAYKAGIFPMAEDADSPDLFWVSPERRGIIPLDRFHVSKSLRKTLKTHPYSVRVDTDFAATIEGCATAGTERESTWINAGIRRLYGELFERGMAHTVEVWEGELMVGGLYGLSLGAAFFGESMFHRRTDASKIALVHLVERLNAGGYLLLDTQFLNPHLKSMGGVEISREAYEERLAMALQHQADFYGWDGVVRTGGGTSDAALQSTSHTS